MCANRNLHASYVADLFISRVTGRSAAQSAICYSAALVLDFVDRTSAAARVDIDGSIDHHSVLIRRSLRKLQFAN